MEFSEYVNIYWKYYYKLEDRLLRTEEYSAFDYVNRKTYSIEYLTIFQAVCSEIDVLAKAMVKLFDEKIDLGKCGIKKWGYYLQSYYKANQHNVIYSMGELFLLNRLAMIHLSEDGYSTINRSRLFKLIGREDEIRATTIIRNDELGEPSVEIIFDD